MAIPKTKSNVLRVDYGNSPSLQQLFASYDPGDEMELTLKIQISQREEEFSEARLLEVQYTDDSSGDESYDPSVTESTSLVVLEKAGAPEGKRVPLAAPAPVENSSEFAIS